MSSTKSITLTPAASEQLIEKAAEQLAAGALQELGGSYDKILTIPLSAAAQMLGIGARTAAKILPVTNLGQKERGVTLYALKKYIEHRTTPPTA